MNTNCFPKNYATSNNSQILTMASQETDSNPHRLLTEEILATGVKQDLGQEWSLLAYEIKDFTKKGDNYSCAVTSVSCEAESKGEKRKTYYVAKLNPLRQLTILDEILNEIFIREGTFFTEVAIKLNQILEDRNLSAINFPKCVYSDFTNGREVLLSKDLRLRGFEMFDRRIGMDFDHSVLVVKELAKIHASSVIFQEGLQKNILELYPFMYDKWLDSESEARNLFGTIFKNSIDISLRLTDQLKGYKIQRTWLKDHRDKAIDVYAEQIKNSPERMKVIGHGDCWNNNILFRYNDLGHPEEVAFVDLQLCRFASLGLDLNYFLYTSLTGEVRTAYYDQLLSAYFEEFRHVMTASRMVMPFTEEDFRREVLDKTLFGVLSGLIILPAVVSESGDIPDFSDMKDDNIEEFLKGFTNSYIKTVDQNPVFKPRFLALFDDILEKGLIS